MILFLDKTERQTLRILLENEIAALQSEPTAIWKKMEIRYLQRIMKKLK